MRHSLLLASLSLSAAPALAFPDLSRYLSDETAAETNADTLLFTDFDWASITPTLDLEYHDCYEIYKCARLDVPLDWNNASDHRRVAVAIMKLPAAVPDDDPAFAGSIFTNPGGPGHSGVTFVPRIGHLMQRVMDKPGKKHYEVVSFDPRGIGFTTPLADCFEGKNFARDEYAVEMHGTTGLAGGLASLTYNRALHDANGKRCKAVDENGDNIFEYLGTPSVARDMVEMLDKIDELRKREQAAKGNDWTELKRRSFAYNGDEDDSSNKDDVPRLQYMGFSYGTVLGNYFASMYPGRVHRMILDSVCDANDYSSGPGWMANIADQDATFEMFLKGCHEAGPKVCAVAREEDSSWKDVQDRIWGFIDALDESPEALIDSNGYNVVVRGRDYRDFVGISLYSPIHTFKLLAYLFNEGVKGNVEIFTKILPIIPNFASECTLPGSGSDNKTMTKPVEADAMSGVLCGDGEDVSGKNLTYWQGYVDELSTISKIWGDRWAEIRFACSRWPFTSKFRFDGPFTTPSASPDRLAGRPSAPLLFFSNRFDPVTPLRSAQAMSSQHTDSAVVIKESMGHGAMAGARSECLEKIASEYFDTGKLPENGTTCEAECGPWDKKCDPVIASAESSVFSREYLEPTLEQRKRFPLGV